MKYAIYVSKTDLLLMFLTYKSFTGLYICHAPNWLKQLRLLGWIINNK